MYQGARMLIHAKNPYRWEIKTTTRPCKPNTVIAGLDILEFQLTAANDCRQLCSVEQTVVGLSLCKPPTLGNLVTVINPVCCDVWTVRKFLAVCMDIVCPHGNDCTTIIVQKLLCLKILSLTFGFISFRASFDNNLVKSFC